MRIRPRSLLAPLAAVVGVAAFALPSHASPGAAYAFAEQKVYGMTLSAAPGSSATIRGDAAGFVLKMSTDAAISAAGLGVAHNGGLDAAQSYVSPSGPAAPVENYSGNAPAGFSAPAGERVLLQAVPTAAGVPNGFTSAAPVAANFTEGWNFARSDSYATPNPDATAAAPGSGSVPADSPPGSWPLSGTGIPAVKLFAPVGTPGTLSIDSVAEALLTTEPHDSVATGVSDWTATGGFSVSGAAGSRAVVSFDFNLIERLIVFSAAGGTDGATASNRLAFDVFDAQNHSVFGPFLGANPSSTRMLTSVSSFSQTYNNATFIPGHLYPGPVLLNFQTLPLAPGEYSFVMKGTSTVHAVAVPEPAGLAAIAASGVALACLHRRRRR